MTVQATSQTTAATDVLPATGSADTIYRVSSWDGTQYTVTSYSEYAWDGTQYQFLCKKSQLDEVFDITVYNSNTKYADLKAALGTNGANVPQELRRGGMSVKFVQTNDNKYVQYLYNGTSTDAADFTNILNWENINLENEFTQLKYGIHLIQEGKIGGVYNAQSGSLARNGTVVEDDGCFTSDFIDIHETKDLLVFNNTDQPKYLCEYDINFNHIRNSYWGIIANSNRNINLTDVADVYYIRTDAYLVQTYASGASQRETIWEREYIQQDNVIEHLNEIDQSLNTLSSAVETNTDNIEANSQNIGTLNGRVTSMEDYEEVEKQGYSTGERTNYISNRKLNTTTGITEYSTDSNVTDFINVDGATTLYIFTRLSRTSYLTLYDAHKEFVDKVSITGGSRTINLSTNFVYARMEFNSNWKDAQTGDIVLDIVRNGNRINVFKPEATPFNIDLIQVNKDVEKHDKAYDEWETINPVLKKEMGYIDDIPYQLHKAIDFSNGSVISNINKAVTSLIDRTDVNIIKSINFPVNQYIYRARIAYYYEDSNYISYNATYLNSSSSNVNLLFSKYIRLLIFKFDGDTEVEVLDEDLKNLRINIINNKHEYTYIGERINIKPRLRWNVIANTMYGDTVQDGDIYGEMLFLFYSQNNESSYFKGLDVIDLTNGKILQQIDLGFVTNAHNNGVTFSNIKWDENDTFPLLYCSGLMNKETFVYRITGEIGSTLELTKVQTLSFNLQYTGYVNKDNDTYVIKFPEVTDVSDRYMVFNLPNPHDGDTTLLADNAIDSFVVSAENPFGVAAPSAGQGGIIIDNVLYQCYGFSNRRNWINAIDLSAHKINSSLNLTDIGIDAEVEGAFYHNGKLGVIFNGMKLIVDIDFNF